MNGLDVAGLRPFDLVIPFTIQKGEITGDTKEGYLSRSLMAFCRAGVMGRVSDFF